MVNDLAEDNKGNIWIVTGSYGIFKYDGKRFYDYKLGSDPAIPSDYVNIIKSDKDNNLWIGFSNGLVKYNGVGFESIDTKGKGVNSIWVTEDNTMLAATDQGGILRHKTGTFDFITNANSGLPSNAVVSVCVDKNNKIWAAMGDYGLGVYDGSNWVRLDSLHNGLPFNNCSSLALTPEGDVIGMFWHVLILNGQIQGYCPHTLAKYDGTRWVPISSKYDNSALRKMFSDNNNGFWYSMNGIGRLVNGSVKSIGDIVKKNLRVLNSYVNPSSSLLFGLGSFIDSKENLWIFGNAGIGIVKIKKGRWQY